MNKEKIRFGTCMRGKCILPVIKAVRLCSISLLLLFCSPLFAQPADEGVVINRVVATVGSDMIMQSDLEAQYLQMLSQGATPPPDVRCRLLEDLLFQKLLKNQAKLDSVTVSESQVQTELDRRIEYFVRQIGSEEALEEYYGKSILEIKDEFRELIEDQLLVQTMQSKITRDVKVSPSEVKKFFQEIPEDSLPYINSEVELAQIVKLPVISESEKEKVKEKLSLYRQRIVNGEASFGTLASLYSEDPSYARDGELGFVSRGDLVPEFEMAAFRLTPIQAIEQMIDSTQHALTQLEKLGGENLEARLDILKQSLDSLKNMRSSPIVETKFGFHLIQLMERRGEQINVRHILLRPKLTEEEKRKAQLTLDSIRTRIMNNEITFAEAVEKYSDDEDTKHFEGNIVNPATGTTRFEMDQLDPVLSFSLNSLSVGNITKPITMQTHDSKEGFRIVLLKNRTAPHQLNLKEDYKRVQDLAQMQKQAKAIGDWIRKKRNNMYIHIIEDFSDCEFMYDWNNGKS